MNRITKTLTTVAVAGGLVLAPAAMASATTDPVVTEWYAWETPGVVNNPPSGAGDIQWPQTLVPGGEDFIAECAVWYQVDQYRGTRGQIDTVTGDGVLTNVNGPEDSSIVIDWYFVYGGDCAPALTSGSDGDEEFSCEAWTPWTETFDYAYAVASAPVRQGRVVTFTNTYTPTTERLNVVRTTGTPVPTTPEERLARGCVTETPPPTDLPTPPVTPELAETGLTGTGWLAVLAAVLAIILGTLTAMFAHPKRTN